MRRAGIVAGALVTVVPLVASAKGGHGSGRAEPYTLSVDALQGKAGSTDVRVDVKTRATGHDAPEVAKHIQLKSFDTKGNLRWVDNVMRRALEVFDTTSTATLRYSDLERYQPVIAQVQVKTKTSRGTHVLRASGRVELRPDISVDHVQADAAVPVGSIANITASLSEQNGDRGAQMDVFLREDGTILDAARGVEVGAGGGANVAFAVSFADPGVHDLVVSAESVSPGDYDTQNNQRAITIEAVQALEPVEYYLSYRDQITEQKRHWDTSADSGVSYDWNRNEQLYQRLSIESFLYPLEGVALEVRADGEVADVVELDDIPVEVWGEACDRNARAHVDLGEGAYLYVDSRDTCDSSTFGTVSYRRSARAQTYWSEGHSAYWGDTSDSGSSRSGAAFLGASERIDTRFVVDANDRQYGGDAGVALTSSDMTYPYDRCNSFGCYWGWTRYSFVLGASTGTTQ